MRVAASWVRTGARFAGVGLCAVLSCAAAMAQVGKPEKLECESLVTPLGMDAEKPTLSWQLRDTRDGAKQTAYEVQVASSATNLAAGKGDIWDSGKVESSDSIGVCMPGRRCRRASDISGACWCGIVTGRRIRRAMRRGGRRDY